MSTTPTAPPLTGLRMVEPGQFIASPAWVDHGSDILSAPGYDEAALAGLKREGAI